MPLLEQQQKIRVAALGTFVAADAFRTDNRIGDRTLRTVGWNFARHFLGLIETNVPESEVTIWTLGYTAGDRWIFDETSGRARSLVYLAYIHRLMELGDQGTCHLNGQSNLAYLRSPQDQKQWGVHWFVNNDREWIIGAAQVPHPALDWRSGSRLFAGAAIPHNAGRATSVSN